MTTTETVGASDTTDRSLHLIINAIEENTPRPGAQVEVTLYLPTGTVMGNLEPCWFFDQEVLGYLQTVGVDHNQPTPTGPACPNCSKGGPPHEYVHLSKVTYHRSCGDVNKHDQVRVRLADVHTWTFGRGQLNVKDVSW